LGLAEFHKVDLPFKETSPALARVLRGKWSALYLPGIISLGITIPDGGGGRGRGRGGEGEA
jgi:hypothetical protein